MGLAPRTGSSSTAPTRSILRHAQDEGLNREIKRRTEMVGIFPNEAAISRLVGAILLEQDEEWAVQRSPYITLESIAPIGADPLVSLPILAA